MYTNITANMAVQVGTGHARVYIGEDPKRTQTQHEQDAQRAFVENTVVRCVKGISLLMCLSTFNIIRYLPPEYAQRATWGSKNFFVRLV